MRNGRRSKTEDSSLAASSNSQSPSAPASQDFWALKDVSFEVRQGEVVGIIGRNGAGKSTLLKILSRITEPTEGRVKIRGRVASLLEVGTGFHPELTGRENIYLNGAILGMGRAEIKSKFDEIVAFAETEKFLDTPVKRYSSGMYVRLAFAVAAHLEPEILVVDEVLAVGDAAFQKKCLGKMGEVARGGRTVLFVSHNMDAVRRLCGRAVWLESGRVMEDGPVNQTVSQYLLRSIRQGGEVKFNPPHVFGNGMPLRLHSVRLEDPSGEQAEHFRCTDAIKVRIEWECLEDIYKARVGFVLQTSDGTDVLAAFDAVSWKKGWLKAGPGVSSCVLPAGLLNEGGYVIDIGADGPRGFDFTLSRTGAVVRFDVEDDMTLPNKYYGEEGFRDARWPGVLLMEIPWTQVRPRLEGPAATSNQAGRPMPSR
jgi:lipopolysaccharide transport system ATP-binding protein